MGLFFYNARALVFLAAFICLVAAMCCVIGSLAAREDGWIEWILWTATKWFGALTVLLILMFLAI